MAKLANNRVEWTSDGTPTGTGQLGMAAASGRVVTHDGTAIRLSAWTSELFGGALNDLSDVSTSGASKGKALRHNGSSYVLGHGLTEFVLGPDTTDQYNTWNDVIAAVNSSSATNNNPAIVWVKPSASGYTVSSSTNITKACVIKAIGGGTWTQNRTLINTGANFIGVTGSGIYVTFEDVGIVGTTATQVINQTGVNSRVDIRNCYITGNGSRTVFVNASGSRTYISGKTYIVNGNTSGVGVYVATGDLRLFDGPTIEGWAGSSAYACRLDAGAIGRMWRSSFWGRCLMANTNLEIVNSYFERLFDHSHIQFSVGGASAGLLVDGAIFNQFNDTHTSQPVTCASSTTNVKFGQALYRNAVPRLVATANVLMPLDENDGEGHASIIRKKRISNSLAADGEGLFFDSGDDQYNWLLPYETKQQLPFASSGTFNIAGSATPTADCTVAARTDLGTVTVTLPTAPKTGQRIDVYDNGDNASVNNITVQPNGKNFRRGGTTSASNRVMTTDGGKLLIIYDGTDWLILEEV